MGSCWFSLVTLAGFVVVTVISSVCAHMCFLGTEPDQNDGGRVKFVLSSGDPCACTAVRLGGHNRYAPPRPNPPVYIDMGSLQTVDADGLRRLFNCVAGNPLAADEAHEVTIAASTEPVNYTNCAAIREAGHKTNGTYTIYPDDQPMRVYCYADNSMGYIGIQRRIDGSVSFNRTWQEYVDGFGSVDGEFWLGNENLKRLTASGTWELAIHLVAFGGNETDVKYATFSVGLTGNKYQLIVTKVDENGAGDSLSEYSGSAFSTSDQDNDGDGSHCAQQFHSGWWFKACDPKSNLNGVYSTVETVSDYEGIQWQTWKDKTVSLQACEMKIRLKN